MQSKFPEHVAVLTPSPIFTPPPVLTSPPVLNPPPVLTPQSFLSTTQMSHQQTCPTSHFSVSTPFVRQSFSQRQCDNAFVDLCKILGNVFCVLQMLDEGRGSFRGCFVVQFDRSILIVVHVLTSALSNCNGIDISHMQ